ncbi:MAG TPA: ABC transporter substrate-binding protein [bacterium]|nr:ABC transporter substrate-binding protein [bacterium]
MAFPAYNCRMRILAMVFSITLLLLPAGCGQQLSSLPEPPRIALVQFVRHPALDRIRHGIMAQFADDSQPVAWQHYDAHGDAAAATAVAAQLSASRPDLIIAIATPAAQACAERIKDLPIIFAAITDPAAAGLVQALDRPGGNLTGTRDLTPVEEQLALILRLQPGLTRLAVISNPAEVNSRSITRRLRTACAASNISLVERTVSSTPDVPAAAQSLRGEADALYFSIDNTVAAAWPELLAASRALRLPLYPADGSYVAQGGVATVAIDNEALGRQTAKMAQRVLAGAAPALMPVEICAGTRVETNDTELVRYFPAASRSPRASGAFTIRTGPRASDSEMARAFSRR